MSEKALNISQLDESTKNYLEGILIKDLADLSSYEIGFIKARRAYLSAEQRTYLTGVLDGSIKGIDVEDDKEETKPELEVDKNGRAVIKEDDFTRATLIQMLRDADITFDPSLNKLGLIALLNNR